MFDMLLSIKYSFAQKMIAKYSDDQNYVILTGEVTEFDKNNVIIKCEELRNYILKILYNYRLKMK